MHKWWMGECIVMDGWMDGWTDGWMNGWMDGWMDDKCECDQLRIRADVSLCVRESLSVSASVSASLVGQ